MSDPEHKPQSWFRTYAEIINDPKLLLIAPSDRWYFVGLLAMKCSAVLDKTKRDKLDRVICQQLRLTASEWEECSRRLQDEDLIDSDYQPINWNKRQFKSDTSTDRVRKYRLEQLRNVSETPPETETETETETEKENTSSLGTNDRVPVVKIVELYHKTLPQLPACKIITNTRRANIKQRWKSGDLPGLDNWEHYFDYVSQSEFLMGLTEGRGDRPPFKADLEWLSKPSNFAKVYEGKYHGV